MATHEDLRKDVLSALNDLPKSGLREVAVFLDYLGYKPGSRASEEVPYKPIALSGLWNGATVSDIEPWSS